MNIVKLFHESALHFEDVIAITDEYGTLTFRELSSSIKQTTRNFITAGIVPGMGVGVCGTNSRFFIIAAYAVMECEAVLMPLSNQLKWDELNEIVNTTNLHAVISVSKELNPFNSSLQEIRILNSNWMLGFNPNISDLISFAEHVSNPALVRFTSGTTGMSKGVILSHIAIQERITAANKVLQLGTADKVLWVLSMAYHFVVSIMLYLHHGAGIIICNDFLASSIIESINKHQATFLYVSPVHIRMLANDNSGTNIESVNKIITTSTAVTREQCELFYSRFLKPVSQAYGIIEIGLPVINFEKQFEVPEAIGYAVPGYEIAILDDQLNELAPGNIGNLAMRGPGMFDGYLSPPVLRHEILQQGWFMTGDLASKDSDGLIKVEGRKKSVINVAGNKVFPEEVERVLNLHPSVILSRVSGFKHELLGESILAELMVTPGAAELSIEEIRNFCRKKLSPYKIPQKIIFTTNLPLTGSGKIKR